MNGKVSSAFRSQLSINFELFPTKWVKSFFTLSYMQEENFIMFVTFDNEMISKIKKYIKINY